MSSDSRGFSAARPDLRRGAPPPPRPPDDAALAAALPRQPLGDERGLRHGEGDDDELRDVDGGLVELLEEAAEDVGVRLVLDAVGGGEVAPVHLGAADEEDLDAGLRLISGQAENG